MPVATIVPIIGFALSAMLRPLMRLEREQIPFRTRRTFLVLFGVLLWAQVITEAVALYSMINPSTASLRGIEYFAAGTILLTFAGLVLEGFTFMIDNRWWSGKE